MVAVEGVQKFRSVIAIVMAGRLSVYEREKTSERERER